MLSRVAPGNHVLDGSADAPPAQEWALLGVSG